jgi:hypothetical protein
MIELLISTAILTLLAYSMIHWMRPLESTAGGLARRFDLAAENARLARQLETDSIAARSVRIDENRLLFETSDGMVHYVVEDRTILRRSADSTSSIASQVDSLLLETAGSGVHIEATFAEDRGHRKTSLRARHLAAPRWIGREMVR